MRIDKKRTFCELLNYVLPAPNQSISQLFKLLDQTYRISYPLTTVGALNNAHGDWYEWLLAIAAWNYHLNNPGSYLLIPLPNATQFDITNLYESEIRSVICDLRSLTAAMSVTLITSNPDFVIINPMYFSFPYNMLNEQISALDIDTINNIDNLYKNFTYKCKFEDIIGYASIKTSLRPDRRLQISHEGSLMKAIYTHIQTRKLIESPLGLKYYALATAIAVADRKALRTVAPHSITTVQLSPQAAVDEVYKVDSLTEAESVFDIILKPQIEIIVEA